MKDLTHLTDNTIRTCTKHFISVNKAGKYQGICPKCFPDLDKYSDPYYVAKRDELIKEADRRSKMAMQMRKIKEENRIGKGGKFFNFCFETEMFHNTMQKLVKENRLR